MNPTTAEHARCTACGQTLPVRELTMRDGRLVCDDCARHIDRQRK